MLQFGQRKSLRISSLFQNARYVLRAIHNQSAQLTTDILTTATASATPSHEASHAAKRQQLDYTALAACTAELQHTCCPSIVEQAHQETPHSLVLSLRTQNQQSQWLRLCFHPEFAHLSMQNEPPARGYESESFAFSESIRSALRGAVLTDVTIPRKWERVLELSLSNRLGEAASHKLYCEFMGKYSNAILTDGSDKVVAAAHQVGGKMTQMRHVQVGKAYELPPPPFGFDPDFQLNSGDSLQQAVLRHASAAAEQNQQDNQQQQQQVVSSLVATFRGISPALARELSDRAGISYNCPVQDICTEQWNALFVAWQDWLHRLQTGTFALSTSSVSTTGAYSVLGSPSTEADDSQTILHFMHDYYGPRLLQDEFNRVKTRILKDLKNAVKRTRSKYDSIKKQAANCDKHLELQHQADLLMANLHTIKPGATSVTVEDWNNPGQHVTIALDPLKTPVAFAEGLYVKARKQRRGATQLETMLDGAEQGVTYLEETELMLQQMNGAEDEMSVLRDVEAELISEGFIKPPVLVQKASKKGQKAAAKNNKNNSNKSESESFRRYMSPSGFTVLIGRHSRQNDELSMKKGQANDVWMHARGVPGAHVLLVVPAGKSPDDSDVQYAADLAAYYSKAQAQGKVDVTCASPSDIRKPKGAKPGQVLVVKEKVVVGRPSASAAALTAAAV